jgi:hypothetical protein
MARRPSPAAAVVALLAVPAPAGAAEIHTDRACYLDQATGNPVTVTGSGFAPSAPYTLLLDGRRFADGTTDARGALSAGFDAALARLGPRADERTFTITAAQGGVTAATRFTITKFGASFMPRRGDPKTMRVRFRVTGFGLEPAAPTPYVYLHYVRPDGRLVRTVRLGRAAAPCGKIRRTRLRRLFPFRAARGDWLLQFDTRRRFTRGTRSSTFSFYTIGVRIRRAA